MSEEHEQGTGEKKPWLTITVTNELAIVLAIGTLTTLMIGLLAIIGAAVGAKNYLYPTIPETQLASALGCTEAQNCVVKQNMGGNMTLFLDAALTLPKDALVRIDGKCSSACVIFADYARPQVCVTENAKFLLHQGVSKKGAEKLGYFIPGHQRDIALWVFMQGDFPNTDGDEAYLPITYPTTLQFWPLCRKENPPTAQPLDEWMLDKTATAKSK